MGYSIYLALKNFDKNKKKPDKIKIIKNCKVYKIIL